MRGILAITYAFMLSCCPYQTIGYEYQTESYSNPTHTAFEIGLDLFNCIGLSAGEETYQTESNGSIFSWNPYTQSYWVKAEYHKTFSKGLSVKAGYKHICQHPVDYWNKQPSYYNYTCSEIYVGIEGRVDLF